MKQTKQKMNKALIIFDLDQTLIQVFDYHEKALEQTTKKFFGFKCKFWEIDFPGKSFKAIFIELAKKHKIKVTSKQVSEATKFQEKTFVKVLPKNLKKDVLPGVVSLLTKLSKKYTVALVTGSSPKMINAMLTRSGLKIYFHLIIDGVQAIDKEHMIKLAKMKARNYGTVVMLGDSVRDIEGGKANKTKTIGLLTGYHSRKKLMKHKPDYIAKNLKDTNVLKLINKWCKNV